MNPEEQSQINKDPKIEIPDNGDDLFIRPLRTYEDDVKEAVQDNGISTSKILMAEQQRRQREQSEVSESKATQKSNLVKIILTPVLILLGLGAIYYVVFYVKPFQKENASPTVVLAPNNFIDREELVKISTQNKTNREVIGLIRDEIKNSESMSINTIKEIEIVKNVETVVDNKSYFEDVNISSPEFLNLLESRVPEALPRALSKDFMLGIHRRQAGAEPFIIFNVADYELAYANMLGWERFLVADIKDIFFKTLGSSQAFVNDEIKKTEPVIVATTTDETAGSTTDASNSAVATSTEMATSTVATFTEQNMPEEPKTPSYTASFKDLILSNRDTRAIISDDGILLYYYSFINPKYLIMTTNLETLNILITRLNSAQLIR